MPLSAEGKRTLKKFIQEYGPEKGKQVFYAKENKGGKWARVVRAHAKKKK